jgi:hypothetical protein
MELQAIALARVVWLMEVLAVDPRGKTSMAEAIGRIAHQYSFSKAPEGLDLEKGSDFFSGKLGNINIDKLSLFGNGAVVDTRSSTDDCKKVLQDFLDTKKELYGATIRPTRQMLLSHILFSSDMQLPTLNPVLKGVADKVSATVSADYKQSVLFEASSIVIGADLSKTKLAPAPFTIERRVDTPFSARLYFSGAPVSTAEHIHLLQDVEAALIA